MSKICDMAVCEMEDNSAKAGFVPVIGRYGDTSATDRNESYGKG